jgi:hypothetical protein
MGHIYTEELRRAATALVEVMPSLPDSQEAISRRPATCRDCQQPMGNAHTNDCRFAPFVPGRANTAFKVQVRTGALCVAYPALGTDAAAVHMAAVDLFGVCAITVKPMARSA